MGDLLDGYAPTSPCDEMLESGGRPRHRYATLYEQIPDALQRGPGATDVSTPSAEALALRRGVCQDFVHASIAVLRAAGVPARYASSYLHPNSHAVVGETVVGQSQAWVGEWQAADPTNGAEVDPRDVLVATSPCRRAAVGCQCRNHPGRVTK